MVDRTKSIPQSNIKRASRLCVANSHKDIRGAPGVFVGRTPHPRLLGEASETCVTIAEDVTILDGLSAIRKTGRLFVEKSLGNHNHGVQRRLSGLWTCRKVRKSSARADHLLLGFQFTLPVVDWFNSASQVHLAPNTSRSTLSTARCGSPDIACKSRA